MPPTFEVPNGLALCALHRLLDHGAITVVEDLRVRVAAVPGGQLGPELV